MAAMPAYLMIRPLHSRVKTSGLIAPGAIGFLLTKRFDLMLVIAAAAAISSSVIGTILSFHIDAATGPPMRRHLAHSTGLLPRTERWCSQATGDQIPVAIVPDVLAPAETMPPARSRHRTGLIEIGLSGGRRAFVNVVPDRLHRARSFLLG